MVSVIFISHLPDITIRISSIRTHIICHRSYISLHMPHITQRRGRCDPLQRAPSLSLSAPIGTCIGRFAHRLHRKRNATMTTSIAIAIAITITITIAITTCIARVLRWHVVVHSHGHPATEPAEPDHVQAVAVGQHETLRGRAGVGPCAARCCVTRPHDAV